MIIADFKIYQYDLPLLKPLIISGKKINSREGIIVHFTSSQGNEAFGEIAPLPGRSKETLDEALKQVKSLKDFFVVNKPIPENLQKLDGHFIKWLTDLSLFPSVQFGIEMAILNLLADAKNIPLNNLISKNRHQYLRINGLLSGSKVEIMQQVPHLLNAGFTAFKLKVGGALAEDIAKVQALSELIQGRALLHIDANQSWSLNDAVTFGNEVGCAAVDYVEDPFKDFAQIPEFFQKTTIPVALDEPLQSLNLDDVKSIDGVFTLILKPTIIGGIEKTQQIIQESRRLGLQTVISSSFESSLAIFTLAQLAGSTARDDHAGLDTGKWFKDNLLKRSSLIEKGMIDLDQFKNAPLKLRFDLLHEIS